MKAKYGVIVILLGLFLLPGLSAWLFYIHPQWLSGQLTNQGELLVQPVVVSDMNQSDTWQLVYSSKRSCTQSCLHAIESLAKVRLALGRHLYGLSLKLALYPRDVSIEEGIRTRLHEMGVGVVNIDEPPLTLAHKPVWIMNPQGRVVLCYQDETRSKDIFADLQKLAQLWGK